MNLLESLLASSTIQMLGWALLHSLWQGILLTILLKGALNAFKKKSANTRYSISCFTLLLMLILPVSTAFVDYSAPQTTVLSQISFSI